MAGISVIIPTYNSEKYLAQAIESILNQKYDGEIEVIISDDGSTDRSLEISYSYLPKIKIVKKPPTCTTQGVSGTRNRGIMASSKDYICFLDSDDFYLQDHLSKISDALLKNSELSFAFCRMIEMQNADGKPKYRDWTQNTITSNDVLNIVLTRSHIAHTNVFIFKREVFERVGYFNEKYTNGEDGDLWMRISERYNGIFSNHYGAVYRSNHSTLQLTKNKQSVLESCYIEIYSNILKRYFELNLNNPYRIFKASLTLYRLKYSSNKSLFYYRYFLIILRFPKQFLWHLYENNLTRRFFNQNSSWYDSLELENSNKFISNSK